MKHQELLKLIFVAALLLASISAYGQDYEVDPSFNPQFNPGAINTFEITTGGKILVGGLFTTVNNIASPKLVRLNPDGSTDTSFISPLRFLGLQIDDEVRSIKTQTDGKILIGGKFPSLGTDVRIARLNADGTLDSSLTTKPTFDIFFGMVRAEPLINGKFMACGPFRDANGTPIKALARFNHDGTVDSSFTTVLNAESIDPQCSDVKEMPNGQIIVVGYFVYVNGVYKYGGARLNADSSLDPTYTVSLPAGGSFGNFRLGQNGESFVNLSGSYPDPNDPGGYINYTGLWKYGPNAGQILSTYDCDNSPILPIPFGQPDGRTMVSGGCKDPWNNTKYQFARFNANNTFDSTLDRVDFGSNSTVTSIDRQADGKYLTIGNFNTVNGLPRRNIVRLRPKTVPTSKPDYDFDGDGKADLAVYRPSQGIWYLSLSAGGYTGFQWGLPTDKVVAADYDNDGKADIAVFRDGTWYIVKSTGGYDYRTFGQAGDTPLVGHFSADDPLDDKVDMILRSAFTSSTSNVRWQFRYFGQAGQSAIGVMPGENISDKLVAADLDGDSIDEYGAFRNGVWRTIALGGSTGTFGSAQSIRQVAWGQAGDIPVAADYDGDGQDDYAIFRPSTGTWWINKTGSGTYAVQWGQAGDIPVPADYDGDGKTDIAIYRGGVWWQLLSTSGVKVDIWGLPGDIPIPAQFIN